MSKFIFVTGGGRSLRELSEFAQAQTRTLSEVYNV